VVWDYVPSTAATSGLLYKPQRIDEGDCGAIDGMKTGRGNRSTRRKPAPAPLCPPQIPHDQTRAIAQAFSRRLPTAAVRVHVGFGVDKVALGQVFVEYFGFPCQFSFHLLLHTHHLSSGAGIIGQLVADVLSGLSLTPLQETKTPGLWSASELYQQSDRRLSEKLAPTLADRWCCVVSATNPHGR
jgi:hypothetical protein